MAVQWAIMVCLAGLPEVFHKNIPQIPSRGVNNHQSMPSSHTSVAKRHYLLWLRASQVYLSCVVRHSLNAKP